MLHGDLYKNTILLAFAVDNIIIQRCLAFIQILHKFADTTLIVERSLLPRLHSLICQSDPKTLGQKSCLPKSLFQSIKIIIQCLKDGTVRHEGYLCSGPVRITVTDHLQSILRIAALISLLVNLSLMENLYFQIIRQSIDDRSANSVKTSGHLISPSAELAAGVKDRKHNLNSRLACLFIDPDGNSTAIVYNRDGIIRMNIDSDMRAGTCECLIDRIVDNLINQMVQTSG